MHGLVQVRLQTVSQFNVKSPISNWTFYEPFFSLFVCVCFCVSGESGWRMIKDGTSQAILSQSRIYLAVIFLALSKPTDNSSRWELDRCGAGGLRQPSALTGLLALGVNTVLANTEPDVTGKMNDQYDWVSRGVSEVDYLRGGGGGGCSLFSPWNEHVL